MNMRQFPAITLLGAALAFAACGAETPVGPAGPAPPDQPASPVSPGKATGPVTIQFVGANVTPGSVISGCGPSISGCAGRVQMTFRLTPPASGPVLRTVAWLHATNQQACLFGGTPGFSLAAGRPQDIVVTFDQFDDCGVPLTIATMAMVVEGTVEVASRQEWAVTYSFAR